MRQRKRERIAPTLSGAAKGACVRVERLPDGEMRAYFIRLGIVEGVMIQILQRLPGGTLVVLFGRQEVALSAELAAQILVSRDDRPEGRGVADSEG